MRPQMGTLPMGEMSTRWDGPLMARLVMARDCGAGGLGCVKADKLRGSRAAEGVFCTCKRPREWGREEETRRGWTRDRQDQGRWGKRERERTRQLPGCGRDAGAALEWTGWNGEWAAGTGDNIILGGRVLVQKYPQSLQRLGGNRARKAGGRDGRAQSKARSGQWAAPRLPSSSFSAALELLGIPGGGISQIEPMYPPRREKVPCKSRIRDTSWLPRARVLKDPRARLVPQYSESTPLHYTSRSAV